jgi:hypothetical protein
MKSVESTDYGEIRYEVEDGRARIISRAPRSTTR